MRAKLPLSNFEWHEWGRRDPLWSGAAWNGKSKDGENPWTDIEFYELGESDWQDFVDYWERFGVKRSSVLEIGCGAGRITIPLANYFKVVHAVDVSEGMIKYAKERVKISSVTFHLSDGIVIPIPDNSVAAVFSCHVFQHLNSIKNGIDYFKEVYRVLQPGGSLMIHLPILVWPCRIGQVIPFLYRLRKVAGEIKRRLIIFLMHRLKVRPSMQMISFPVDFIHKTLVGLGFYDVEISIFPTKSNGDLHPFVFARK